MSSNKKWLPLESNPDVMNKYLQQLGVPEQWNMIDIIALDDEYLSSVPSNVKAVLMLFPTGEKHGEYCQFEQDVIEAEGQLVSDRVYFIKMDASNSSGTVALIHSVANAEDDIQLGDDSSLKDFLDRTRYLTPEERGQELEINEDIIFVHESLAKEGQSEAPESEEETNLHFIAFVCIDEQLYELDSKKAAPINHGETSKYTLLRDAVAACKQFMERDPENLNFTLMALVENEIAVEEEDEGGEEQATEEEEA